MARNVTSRGYIWYKEVTQNPANILAGAVNEESFTVSAAQPGHWIECQAPSLETGLIFGKPWCDVVGTVKMRIANNTVEPINPASQVFYFLCR
jgi:hypothetical protein